MAKDLSELEFRYVNAGHSCSLCCDANKALEQLAFDMYCEWIDNRRIGKAVGLDVRYEQAGKLTLRIIDEVEDHAFTFLWDRYRMKFHTIEMYESMLAAAIPYINAEPSRLGSKVALLTGKQLDIVKGRERQGPQANVNAERDILMISAAIAESVKETKNLELTLKIFERFHPPELIEEAMKVINLDNEKRLLKSINGKP